MTISATVDQLTRPEPKRDRWGRYLIVPTAGGKARSHTRVTTFAKSIADTYNLTEWAKRNVALGMAQRSDLVAMAHGLTHDDKAAMKEVVEAAEEASGANERRRLGTAIHRMCERVDAGELPLDQVPDAQRADVAAYRARLDTAGVEVLPELIERICVIDPYTLAGTFDRVVRFDGRLMVADIKTGREVSYGAGEMAIQLACYANATSLYEPTTEQHEPMPELDRTRGLIIHLPAGEARCELHLVDLTAGWQACELAASVRKWRSRKDLLVAIAPDAALPLAVEPDAEPTPAATPERRQWVVDRVQAVIGHQGTNGGKTAPETLVGLWPAGVPTLKDFDGHTDAQLDQIAKVLDEVEARFGIGFGAADPAAPPTKHAERAALLAERTEEIANPPERPATGPDEGATLGADARAELKDAVSRIDPAAQTALEQWVLEAADANVPISTNLHNTERRHALVRAAIRLAVWDPDDDAARTAIGCVLGAEVQSAITVGAALGVLTIDEANRLHQVATDLVGGASITFDSDGVPSLAAA